MTSNSTVPPKDLNELPTLFGHPTGLYTLFFAEMWERFSFYGMRALLVYYMVKGFLGYDDPHAYAIYGAYGGLVYMMPFFGGMIADRLIGARRAVVLGGALMAAGHLLMMWEATPAFYCALALLICGNGFFKPNISMMVGSLYAANNVKRDGGFTLFYMGINLGAAMAPLVCGYIGEKWGWHWGFGLATFGMLTGLAVFVFTARVAQFLVLGGSLTLGIGMFFLSTNPYLFWTNAVIGTALIISGCVATFALSRGGLPRWAGAPTHPERLRFSPWVYLGVVVAVPVIAWLVWANAEYNLVSIIWGDNFIAELKAGSTPLEVWGTFLEGISTPAGLILFTTWLGATIYLFATALRSPRIVRHRMYVVLILTFFSFLFWAFFEQAGSSVSNYTDRNVDRVFESQVVEESDIGKTLDIVLTQEQLGYSNGDQLYTLDVLTRARDAQREAAENAPEGEDVNTDVVLAWTVDAEDVGMGIADVRDEIPGSTFQSVNPSYILVFGLLFTALWGILAKLKIEPSTPIKFSLGLLQLGLGFLAFWYGAQASDERGMVFAGWLLLGYLLHTTGELCLSPVGLSMVTKLSPQRLVSTVMGAWFLATAASSFLAAIIAQLTGVAQEGEGEMVIPIPAESVHVYGDVFKVIAYLSLGSAVICFILSPLLTRWMHAGEEVEPEGEEDPQAAA